MKKIILLICILIGVSSCDMIAEDIQESKNYFEDKKLERIKIKLAWNFQKKILKKYCGTGWN